MADDSKSLASRTNPNEMPVPLSRQTTGILDFRTVTPAIAATLRVDVPDWAVPFMHETPAIGQPTSAANVENRSPLIVLVLDASGSMNRISTAIRESVNNFITQQKAGPIDDTRMSFVVFSSEATVRFIKKPIAEVQSITSDDYQCGGDTALFDAIGLAIDRHEDEKEALIVIVTDGEENCSRTTHDELQSKIEAKKTIGWQFIYLANEPRVSQVGVRVGLECAAAGSTHSNTNNVSVGYDNLAPALERQISKAVSAYRATSQVPNLNEMNVRSRSLSHS